MAAVRSRIRRHFVAVFRGGLHVGPLHHPVAGGAPLRHRTAAVCRCNARSAATDRPSAREHRLTTPAVREGAAGCLARLALRRAAWYAGPTSRAWCFTGPACCAEGANLGASLRHTCAALQDCPLPALLPVHTAGTRPNVDA